MARTHEQTGLRKPANRATEMCAVDGKNLELFTRDPPHPAGGIGCFAIGRHYVGIAKGGQPGLAFGKIVDVSQWDPREIAVRATAGYRRGKKSHDRNG